MSKKASNPQPLGPKPHAPPSPQRPEGHNSRKAVTIGQVMGLKFIERDGSWNITVNVQREKVPANIEQWGYQTVAVAVMKDMQEAERALEEDVFGA